MTRKTLKLLLAAIVAVLALGSIAEAAGPKKVVRGRTTTAKKHVVTHKRHTAARKKATAKKRTAVKKHIVKAKRKPTTKPR